MIPFTKFDIVGRCKLCSAEVSENNVYPEITLRVVDYMLNHFKENHFDQNLDFTMEVVE